jgi:hypothetical protein
MDNATQSKGGFDVSFFVVCLYIIVVFLWLVRRSGLPRRDPLLKADGSFSNPLTAAEVQAHGSFTVFPVRRPRDLSPFEDARDEIRTLWEEYMQDGLIKTNMCTECPVVGDYLGVAYPGTRPERIKAFTWLYTMFFLLDGRWSLRC